MGLGAPHIEPVDLSQRATCARCAAVSPLAAGSSAHCPRCGFPCPVELVLARPDGECSGLLLRPHELLEQLGELARRRRGRVGEAFLWRTAPELLLNCIHHYATYAEARAELRRWLARQPRPAIEVRLRGRSADGEGGGAADAQPSSHDEVQCAYCHDALEEDEPPYACDCGSLTHPECRLELGRCPTIGCAAPYRGPAPAARARERDEASPREEQVAVAETAATAARAPGAGPAPSWLARLLAWLPGLGALATAALAPLDLALVTWGLTVVLLVPAATVTSARRTNGLGLVLAALAWQAAASLALLDDRLLRGPGSGPDLLVVLTVWLPPWALLNAGLAWSLARRSARRRAEQKRAPGTLEGGGARLALAAAVLLGLVAWRLEPLGMLLVQRRAASLLRGEEPELRRLLLDYTSPEDAVRDAAHQRVRWRLHDPAVNEPLRTLLRDPDPYVRVAAAEVLGSNGAREPQTVRALVVALTDREGMVREAASWSLWMHAGDAATRDACRADALEPLLRQLQDPNPDLRRLSLWSIGELRDVSPAVIARILPLLEDASPVLVPWGTVADAAERALLRQGVAALPVVERELERLAAGPESAPLAGRLREIREQLREGR